jgi:hypothetical protein
MSKTSKANSPQKHKHTKQSVVAQHTVIRQSVGYTENAETRRPIKDSIL